MRILTCDEVRRAEHEAINRPGGSTLLLMERAGRAVAEFCLTNFKFRSVCVLCGKGNNGGDGLVAAEALRRHADVSVIILAKDPGELSPDAAAMGLRLGLDPLWISSEAELETSRVQEAMSADLILDAIVGTGFKPPLRGLAKAAVAAINETSGAVVGVDLPSGVDADSSTPIQPGTSDVVLCHGIVTFIAPKPAHVFADLTAGPIAVSEIGVSPPPPPRQINLRVITGREVGIAFPSRPNDAHKGLFGHLLIVAGSRGKAGAAALAGMAALRSGAGLVTVACPRSIQATVAAFAPELMTEGVPETREGTLSLAAGAKLEQLTEGKDVMVLGPGLSTNAQTVECVRQLAARSSLPMVLDADALNAFAGRHAELKKSQSPYRVLTPHPGEAARLMGTSTANIQNDRQAFARKIAESTSSAVVLKGWRTIVAGGSGETWINMSGNPALAKGGSGDVLSGMIGSALAQHMAGSTNGKKDEPEKRVKTNGSTKKSRQADRETTLWTDVSMVAAVHLHGLAADVARNLLHENTVVATDLFNDLSRAFRNCDLQLGRELFYLQI